MREKDLRLQLRLSREERLVLDEEAARIGRSRARTLVGALLFASVNREAFDEFLERVRVPELKSLGEEKGDG